MKNTPEWISSLAEILLRYMPLTNGFLEIKSVVPHDDRAMYFITYVDTFGLESVFLIYFESQEIFKAVDKGMLTEDDFRLKTKLSKYAISHWVTLCLKNKGTTILEEI